MTRILWILFWFCCSYPSLAKSSFFRQDLAQIIGPYLCSQQAAPPPEFLWKHQIYDAQLEAALVSSDGPPLSSSHIASIANQKAIQMKKYGISYGLCSSQQGYYILSHLQTKAIELQAGDYILQPQLILAECRDLRLEFAPLRAGAPKEILKLRKDAEKPIYIHQKWLEAGTLGLSCRFAASKKKAPELLALLPATQEQEYPLPFAEVFSSPQPKLAEFEIWIQKLRQRAGLPSLRSQDRRLQKISALLAQTKSLQHPHLELINHKKQLEKTGVRLLGENRVIARDPRAMAWLLWYSPSHRRLLLHKSADALALQLAELESENLLVLVLAKL